MNRRPLLAVACGLCLAALPGCASAHRAATPTAPRGSVEKVQKTKIAAIEKTKKAVTALPPTNVVGSHTGCEGATNATWSPDGKQIAWPGRKAICVANLDGSNAHPLPQTLGRVDSVAQLSWIKPGLILYGGNYTISRLPIGAEPELYKGIEAPQYSVDAEGNLFATSTQSDCPGCTGPAHVWTMSGKLVGTIGDDNAFHGAPSFSPDGTRVAYEQNGGIWVAATNGSGARELVSSGGSPLWSPTGGEIAYSSPDGLAVVPAGGGSSRLVARGVSDNGGWSPNGKLIASWGIGGLDVVDIASGKLRKLPFVGYPGFGANAWSPDSKQLLVTARLSSRCFSLWREPVDGSKPRLLSSCF